MKKKKLVTILVLIPIFILSVTILTAEKKKEPEAMGEEPEVKVKVDEADLYTYEKLREMAKAGRYEGEPAKGYLIGYTDPLASLPFCQACTGSIIEQWGLAGGAKSNLIILNNDGDPMLGLQNADTILSKGPKVFICFQFDKKVNAMISKKAEDAGTFVIAVDIPVPGFPFMGVDNYGCGKMAGEYTVKNIDKEFGGWENVDRVLYLYTPAIGEEVAWRILASKDVLIEEYGDEADPDVEGSKALLYDCGYGGTDETKEVVLGYLSAYPNDKNIIVFNLSDMMAAGVHAAAEVAGRWDPDSWYVFGQGLDDLGKKLIREGVVDADVAYFPETYGEYLIPAAIANIYGNPLPAYLYVENEVVTKENINSIYPE